MKLLDEYLDDCYQRLKRKERDVRFVFLGDKAPFTPSLRAKMEKIEEESKNNIRCQPETCKVMGIMGSEGEIHPELRASSICLEQACNV